MTIRTLLEDEEMARILAALPQARLVGGCVRDALAGRWVVDIDMATPDPPATTVALLRDAGIKSIPTGIAHGTVTALAGGRPFEITTLRRDEETDGRHARVAWTDDWREDAARRDFTFNAMFLDRHGTVYDFFGGQQDLRDGRVRFVGDPALRIAEDRLRILRYFRFVGRFGSAEDQPALDAIAEAAPGLVQLSAERVWSELKRIITQPDPANVLRTMQDCGVLGAILPDGTDVEAFARLVAWGAPPDPALRLAALSTSPALADAARLKLSNSERDMLEALKAAPALSPHDDPAVWRAALADTRSKILAGRVWLSAPPSPERQALLDWLQTETVVAFPLEGRDAVALGVKPGPEIGRLLAAVRSWWLHGGCVAGRDACLVRLKSEVRQGGG